MKKSDCKMKNNGGFLLACGPQENNKTFVRKCAKCALKISGGDNKVLSWEAMEFCNEDCLSKYQNKIGSHCVTCKKNVQINSLGKYCVRFGDNIRQFCCSVCLEEYKKVLTVCYYCQKEISVGTEGILAATSDKRQFMDFCSLLCVERCSQMSNKNLNNDIAPCSVCNNEDLVHMFREQCDKNHKVCSESCSVQLKFMNGVDTINCDVCKKYFKNGNNSEFAIFHDNVIRNFCCKTCQNIYITSNRRIVSCSWCKVKKYNFDMVKKSCIDGKVVRMCSLNCLSLYQVSANTVYSKKVLCDHCFKLSEARYHLTMSDATIRNFCTYNCIMSFQNQFSKQPITLWSCFASSSSTTTTANSNAGTATAEISHPLMIPVVPASESERYPTREMRPVPTTDAFIKVQIPAITNVQSTNATNSPSTVTSSTTTKVNNQRIKPQTKTTVKGQVNQQLIVTAAPLPSMRNAATWCRPHVCSQETQTDEIVEKTILVPVPVPIYVPAPMHMYSAPLPIPVPFPLPIPVPIFIPTTRNSAAGIMKKIKKIQAMIPTDPFEAELLKMAEIVAGEKKTDTDSDSDNDDNIDSAPDESFIPEAVDTSTMLQMTTQFDALALNLEGASTTNSITASQNQDETFIATEEFVDESQLIDRQALHDLNPSNCSALSINPSKQEQRPSNNAELPLLTASQSIQPPGPTEKPDANMCLKYTLGVIAWKQWVATKNAELEKSSRSVKFVNSDILQLTVDELNYSLSLFVEEVRKPNGTEYTPDTIYYLCLGIQLYLFENGRIDNIFTDSYYKQFTDCLDKIVRKFSVLYNDSHYIVTRVEEEHLWESKQLGAHSPRVLLNTLMFFNTKHYNLTSVDQHLQLSFSHIMKHWKRTRKLRSGELSRSRNIVLQYYPIKSLLDAHTGKRKVYEQQEDEENPLRCPVKLYEFYLSKCPENSKTRDDVFYLLPERSCVPDSPLWYSTMGLGQEELEKIFNQAKMVKEINLALLLN